ncbi:hypothetical protein [Zestomonas carbonaria]|uniref:DnaJ domain-containing protein n=1 Tax=Zestomonas carbonaria TaxID=2762745 RepID=A0A7U7ELR6_9GAMM|nr:hypothetical protein [Pseudomonas carbonaria]CAD5106777.1 hypothetical protein PSEWESI4_01044 [Pseudomonas carbonaria]
MAKKRPALRAVPAVGKPITGSQRKFNALVEKIEQKRELLEAWQVVVVDYEQRWGEEFLPLLDEEAALNVELVELLDRAAEQVELADDERATLDEVIVELVPRLLGSDDDEALKSLFDRHSEIDFATLERETASLLRAEMGLDEEAPEADGPESGRPRDVRAEERSRQASRTVREVYRKLAGPLHPDREQDDAERERKTALMQRVNQAYEHGNLLELLELQLELEQIRPGHLADLPEEKLRHFIHVLDEQLAEIEDEVLNEEQLFRERFAIEPMQAVSPKIVRRLVRERTELLREDVAWLREDVARVAGADAQQLREWLREERKSIDEADELNLLPAR